MALGGQFLDYDMLDPHHPVHGQHLGIILVEVGVLFTVAATSRLALSVAGRAPAGSPVRGCTQEHCSRILAISH
ncbi:MAG: hypothetical protein ACNA8W_21115 [Bradymonadaceae bacterium]